MRYQDQQKELIKELQEKFDSGAATASVIESVDDFESDTRLCLTVLAFPPKEVLARIDQIQNRLREADEDQYYYPEHAIHITVKNIRVVADPPGYTDEDVAKVCDVAREVVKRHEPFSVHYETFLRAPTSISAAAYTDDHYGDLVLDLINSLKEAGVPDNKKYISDDVFFINSSFVRYTKQPNEKFFEVLHELEAKDLGSFEVKDISVITTNAVLAEHTFTNHGTYKLGVDQDA